MKFEDAVDWCKRVWLRRVVGYQDSKRYWDARWNINLKSAQHDYSTIFRKVKVIMDTHGCKSVLEVGCGKYPLVALPGHIALDFSKVALDESGLKEYIFADITNRIPLPDKSVDAVYSGNILLHIPPEKVWKAVEEYQRVARKCIILTEPVKPYESKFNCYWHDLASMFGEFSGAVVFTEKEGA